MGELQNGFSAALLEGAKVFKKMGSAVYWSENIAYFLLIALSVTLCILTLKNMKRFAWDSFHFVLLTISAALLFLLRLTPMLFGEHLNYSFYYMGRVVFFCYIPVFLYLHTRHQVSYKGLNPVTVGIILALPFIMGLLVLNLQGYIKFAKVEGFQLSHAKTLMGAWYLAFTFIALLNCFRVFYQMPKHMRRSTYYLTVSILCNLAFAFFVLSSDSVISFWASVASISATLIFAYAGCTKSVSANVIVTSQELLMSKLSTYVLVLSRSMHILDWNKKEEDGFAPLPTPFYRESFTNYKERLIKETGGKINKEMPNIISTIKDGEEKQFLINVHDVSVRERKYGHVVEIFEVTLLYDVLRQLEDVATLDQLTGLYSRNAYMEKVKTITNSDNLPLGIILGDVNGLKPVNDTYGHIAGDKLLECVARTISLEASEKMFCARIGGDEYVCLVPNAKEEELKDFITNINERFKQINDPYFKTPSVSWGYSMLTSPEEEYNSVFKVADSMMYETKRKQNVFRSRGLVGEKESDKG